MKIIVSGPFTSWQINGETMETVTNFIFLGSQITADGDYSHEIKRCLLPGRKAITNLDNVLKNRHYFANKGPFSQSYSYPEVMYRHESLDVRVEPQRRQSTDELMLLNCGIGEGS